MEKKIYLMRHGQTLFNLQKKIQGYCDSPLTTLGIQQAIAAKKKFEELGVTFDAAYSSTSERACDTLELITDLPYSKNKGLKEWNFGSLEAEHEYLNPPLPYGNFFVQFGGEDEKDFKHRITKTIQTIVDNEKGKNILIVSHGAACAQFIRNWSHISTVQRKGPLKNCCILEFIFYEQDKLFELINIMNPDIDSIVK